MTVLRFDHSEDWDVNVRGFVVQYLEDPDRDPVIGFPKAQAVTVKVTTSDPDRVVASRHAVGLAERLAADINQDGRLVVNRVELDANTGEPTQPVLELVPWPNG